MKSHDLIDALRHVIYCYDQCCNSDSALARELKMWRLNFLGDQLKSFSSEKAYFIRNAFLCKPHETFMSKTPEENIKEIIECWNSNKHS